MNSLKHEINLEPEHWAQMEADVSAKEPEEACGIVAGLANRSSMVIPVTNMLHSPNKFRMEPAEELNAFYIAEREGLEIIAIYHSHPHGMGEPSITDFTELTFPGIIYLIWYKDSIKWQCRGFLMDKSHKKCEIQVIITME